MTIRLWRKSAYLRASPADVSSNPPSPMGGSTRRFRPGRFFADGPKVGVQAAVVKRCSGRPRQTEGEMI